MKTLSNPYIFKRLPFFVLVNVVSQRVLVNTAKAAAQQRWSTESWVFSSVYPIYPTIRAQRQEGDVNTLAPFAWSHLAEAAGIRLNQVAIEVLMRGQNLDGGIIGEKNMCET